MSLGRKVKNIQFFQKNIVLFCQKILTKKISHIWQTVEKAIKHAIFEEKKVSRKLNETVKNNWMKIFFAEFFEVLNLCVAYGVKKLQKLLFVQINELFMA